MTKLNKIISIFVFALTIIFSTESIAIGLDHTHGKGGNRADRENFKVRCSKVELLDAQLVSEMPMGSAIGPAHFIIGGKPLLATATIDVLGEPQPQPDGTANILVHVKFDFGDGDILLALARGVLIATDNPGLFENNALISYLDGSGMYEKAYGRFDSQGFINFADLTVEMYGEGEVCNRQKVKVQDDDA
jgi:hypothetical protein